MFLFTVRASFARDFRKCDGLWWMRLVLAVIGTGHDATGTVRRASVQRSLKRLKSVASFNYANASLQLFSHSDAFRAHFYFAHI